MRSYNGVIDKEDLECLLKIEEWNEIKSMMFDQGDGYWCKDSVSNIGRSDDDVFYTEQEDATHVIRFNK